MRKVLTRETDFQFNTWMCLDSEPNRSTKNGGLGVSGGTWSGDHCTVTVTFWGPRGTGVPWGKEGRLFWIRCPVGETVVRDIWVSGNAGVSCPGCPLCPCWRNRGHPHPCAYCTCLKPCTEALCAPATSNTAFQTAGAWIPA